MCSRTCMLLMLIVFSNCVQNHTQVSASIPKESKVEMDKSLIAAVRENNKWKFINPNGQVVFDEEYTYADNFSDGYACINLEGIRTDDPQGVIGGKFRFMQIDGEINEMSFDTPAAFQEKLAIIEEAGSRSIIDAELNIIKSYQASVLPCSNGLLAAFDGEKTGYLNKEGKWAISLQYGDMVDSFSDGFARVKRNGKTGYINTDGEWIIEPKYETAYLFKEDRAAIKKDGKFGFIDEKGNQLIPFEFENAGDFSEGLCAVMKNGKWGFINPDGSLIIDFLYDECQGFSEELATILLDGKVGYIDSSGKIVIEAKFESAFDFKNGYAIAQASGKLGFIDKTGKWIIEPKYERVNQFVDPYASNPLLRIN